MTLSIIDVILRSDKTPEKNPLITQRTQKFIHLKRFVSNNRPRLRNGKKDLQFANKEI